MDFEYRIGVIQKDGKQAFQLLRDDCPITFERLSAATEFTGGLLEIYRDGILFSKTSCIRSVGTFGAYEVFEGLNEVFAPAAHPQFLADLLPSMLKTGDVISIKPHQDTNTEFVGRLILDMQRGGGYSHATLQAPIPS